MPFQKPVQKSLSQHKRMRKLCSYEEKGLLMQYHSINIEKLQKRMKNKFSNIAYQIRWSVGDDFKIIVSTKFNAVESNHSDESDIIRIYITFLEKTFFGQSILTLYEAFKVAVFTVMLLLRRNTSLRYA